jgi:hypothetical protein
MEGVAHTGSAANAERPSEVDAIRRWRVAQLRQAGYRGVSLMLLADDLGDLQCATQLVERGCPQATALRILL